MKEPTGSPRASLITLQPYVPQLPPMSLWPVWVRIPIARPRAISMTSIFPRSRNSSSASLPLQESLWYSFSMRDVRGSSATLSHLPRLSLTSCFRAISEAMHLPLFCQERRTSAESFLSHTAGMRIPFTHTTTRSARMSRLWRDSTTMTL